MTRLDLRSERGFTMMAVMVVMAVATVVASGAMLAAQQDLPFSKASSDRKQAYAAAEAGVEYYLHRLTKDNEYWTKCTNVPAPAPISQKGATPRKWRTLAGTNASYTIELMPANGAAQCIEGQADKTLLDQSTGTIKIRATGRAGDTTRSIVAEFRRNGFLDFLYFTDYETFHWEAYASQSDRDWARTNCMNRYRADRTNRWGSEPCANIQFAGDDVNRGPFHTNDDILLCAGYTLGRSPADKIEIVGPARWAPGASCASGDPRVEGTLDWPATRMEMPTTNTEVRTQALPQYTYTGRTWIRLDNNQMEVTTWNSANQRQPPKIQALPDNGVISVRNGTCATKQPPVRQSYNEAPGCANVTVWGNYSKSLTITSEKDIVVGAPVDPTNNTPQQSSANLRRNGDVVLGLIADNFVRVSHAVSRQSDGDCNGNRSPTMRDITIDAAILSLNHSFIADNHDCGDLGTLTVNGAIAQKYRGPVGTTGPTGFIKAYEYDDRLRYRSPPYFLTPIQAAWNIMRENEQVPAAAQD